MTKISCLRGILTLGLCLSLAGCSFFCERQTKAFVEPRYGMNRRQLIDLLGEPKEIEIYQKTDLTRLEFYIYVRKDQLSQSQVPVGLIDKKVVGWGKTYYDDQVNQDYIRIR